MRPISFFLPLALLISSCAALAQETQKPTATHLAFKPVHSLGLAIGNSHVLKGHDAEGNNKNLALPMWGFDHNFQFSQKWMIGIHTDLVVETFEVEKHLASGEETEVVERTNPVAPAIMGFFKPNHHWNIGLGMGGEFAREENYIINRAALEYGVEIRNGWEVFGALQYDLRWDAYDTWTIGSGSSKALGKKGEKESGPFHYGIPCINREVWHY